MVSSKASTSRRVLLTGENRGHNHKLRLRSQSRHGEKSSENRKQYMETRDHNQLSSSPCATCADAALVSVGGATHSALEFRVHGAPSDRGGREDKETKTCMERFTRLCVDNDAMEGGQGQEGQRDDLPEDTHSHQSCQVHASPSPATLGPPGPRVRRVEEWSQDKARHVADIWRSLTNLAC